MLYRKQWNKAEQFTNITCKVIYIHIYIYIYIYIYILGVQLCFRRFFSEIRGFIVKNWLYIYDSKYCPSLAITFSHLSGSVRIPHRKNWSSFEVIHESNFLLLHKIGSVSQPGRAPLIETSDDQREQRLENTAGGVGLPISTFPSMS